jgi:hypothetical protein
MTTIEKLDDMAVADREATLSLVADLDHFADNIDGCVDHLLKANEDDGNDTLNRVAMAGLLVSMARKAFMKYVREALDTTPEKLLVAAADISEAA